MTINLAYWFLAYYFLPFFGVFMVNCGVVYITIIAFRRLTHI